MIDIVMVLLSDEPVRLLSLLLEHAKEQLINAKCLVLYNTNEVNQNFKRENIMKLDSPGSISWNHRRPR